MSLVCVVVFVYTPISVCFEHFVHLNQNILVIVAVVHARNNWVLFDFIALLIIFSSTYLYILHSKLCNNVCATRFFCLNDCMPA
jgi:hypothetical protein